MTDKKTIQQWVGFDNLLPKTFAKATPLPNPDPSLIYGVELEIENTQGRDWVVSGVTGKEDGSLRNSGYEYVTEPATFSNLAYMLDNFFKKSGVTEKNYSERCSVHVHTNCRDLTWEQVSTICLLYQMLEKLLFAFVGEDRDKNIFCVPWSETTLTYNLINQIKGSPNILKQWQKYTALNLLPLFQFGTIEWRHMGGTYDKERILNWCRIIGCLFAHARNNSLEDTKKFVINLNTTSEYRKSIDVLFGDWAQLLYTPNYEVLLEEGVLNMKYTLLHPKSVTISKNEFEGTQLIIEDDLFEENIGVGGGGNFVPPIPAPDQAQAVHAWFRREDNNFWNEIRAREAQPVAQERPVGGIAQMHEQIREQVRQMQAMRPQPDAPVNNRPANPADRIAPGALRPRVRIR